MSKREELIDELFDSSLASDQDLEDRIENGISEIIASAIEEENDDLPFIILAIDDLFSGIKDSYFSAYDDSIENIASILEESGFDIDGLDDDVLDAIDTFKRHHESVLDGIKDSWVDRITSSMVGNILEGDIPPHLERYLDIAGKDLRDTLVGNSSMFDAVVIGALTGAFKVENGIFVRDKKSEVEYSYSGPVDNRNRPFCAKTMRAGGHYTMAELSSMFSPQQFALRGTDPAVSAVSYPCRHQWIPVKR